MKKNSKNLFFGFQKKTIIWFLYLIILIPICFEIALRIVGAKPYIQKDYHIKSIPENPFLGHDSLAIVLNPGMYKITLNEHHTFTTTHTKDQFRKVSFYKSQDSLLTQIAIFGCSFTYGFGVHDTENFTSLLQKKHANYQFNNYGVIGYGTTHSYLQLKKLAQHKFPKVVVLNFATDHFNRNVLTNSYKRALKIGFNRSLKSVQNQMKDAKYPVTLNTQLAIGYQKWSDMYEDWNGRSLFSSINWLQTTIDKIDDNAKNKVEISFALINEMNTICKKNNAIFLVSLLDQNQESDALKKLLIKHRIRFLNVDFNFENKQFTNFPYDNHPNKLGHELIAEKINNQLQKILDYE
ncbi:hypothetical protein [Polaribacter sp.]|uniref:hypothetical protein n=1 Tax=Polaribacter sp. TaxID=1920175 RepID=UPI003F4A8EB3